MILAILVAAGIVVTWLTYDKNDTGSWLGGVMFAWFIFFAAAIGGGGFIGHPAVVEKTPVENVQLHPNAHDDNSTIVTFDINGKSKAMVIGMGTEQDEMHVTDDNYYVVTERKPIWWLSPVAWPVDDYDLYVSGDK